MKFLKYTLIALTSVLLIFAISELFRRKVGGFAGSYPFVETWTVNHRIEDVESKIKELQVENPSLFKDSEGSVISPDATGYYKRVDFFYPERQEVVKVLLRSVGETTTVVLVSFTDTETGEVRLMNRDFNFLENNEEKRMFENRILKLL